MTPPRFLAAISTPFAADGSVALDAFGEHVAWLADAGLDGVVVAGTTGEGVLLEADEIVALTERASAAGDGLRVIAQVGRPSTRATAALARRAIEAGADAVAAYVPWFYPASDADVRTHFEGLLEAAGSTPAFLYNIPRRTVNDLSAELAGELAAAGFKGMKDSTGSFERHEAYLDATRGRDFELYIGSEPLVLRAYRDGAAGVRDPHQRGSGVRELAEALVAAVHGLVVASANTSAFRGCEPSPGRPRDARQCAALAALACTPMLGSRAPTRARISVGDH